MFMQSFIAIIEEVCVYVFLLVKDRMRGTFGGDFDLAVWQIGFKLPN